MEIGRRRGNGAGQESVGESPIDVIIVLPEQVRLDSRLILLQTTISWLTNCAFCFSLWLKLSGLVDMNWWMVFSPTWIYHWLHVPFNVAQVVAMEDLVEKQMGLPPLDEATNRVYEYTRRMRIRSNLIDCVNNIMESFAMFISKAILVYQLDDWWDFGIPFGQTRYIFIPIWAVWLLTLILNSFKNREDRIWGGPRDIYFIVILIISFKIDNQLSYSWRIIFAIPWLLFGITFIIAIAVLVLLILARFWNHIKYYLLAIGFLMTLVSSTPLLISLVLLAYRLDGDKSISITAIFVPSCVGWLLMWLSSIVMFYGMRIKEIERERNRRQISNRLIDPMDQVAINLNYDTMNEEDILNIAQRLMEGKTVPYYLIKTGQDLFKRLSSLNANDRLLFKEKHKREISEYLISDEQKSLSDMISSNIATEKDEDSNLEVEVYGSHSAMGISFHKSHIDEEESVEELPEILSESCSMERDRCIICFEGKGLFVFLDCGHGGFCKKCAFRLFIRPPRRCPTCRQEINQVVELNNTGSLGDVVIVKLNENQ